MTVLQLYRLSLRLVARRLARLGVLPNQVTYAALAVSLAGSALLAAGVAPLVAAVAVLLGGWLDAVDGELARCSARASKFGSYLDAMCDRVADGAVLLAIGLASRAFVLCLLAATASAWVSYAKARAALELPVSNSGWPSLMGREARVILFSAGIAVWGLEPTAGVFDLRVIDLALIAVLLGAFYTALRRFGYARRLLFAADGELTLPPTPALLVPQAAFPQPGARPHA